MKQVNFKPDQCKLIFDAVRRYQIEKCVHDSKEYWECNSILDELFDCTFTQRKEQQR
jgi:hypothetical protein